MIRRRVDDNQMQIVIALRQAGASVQHLHTVGHGCPDVLVGIAGRNILIEIKDGTKKPSARRLTPDEERWHQGWRGQIATVASIEEALAAIGISAGSGGRARSLKETRRR